MSRADSGIKTAARDRAAEAVENAT